MSDFVVDSSVVAKWILPEEDSAKALEIVSQAATAGERLIALDLAFVEVTNAIWKRYRQQLVDLGEANQLVAALTRSPVELQPAVPLLSAAFQIAARYSRAVYDALFVALTLQLGLSGITADEPLFDAVHADFPQIILLRDFS